MSEHQEQCTVVSWFKTQYPDYRDCIMAIPNGAILCDLPKNRRLARMRYLIAEGFKKGASDLLIAVPRGGKHGLWVEMKDRCKTLCSVSQDQLDHLEVMRGQGYEAIWCAGSGVAIGAIKVYMKGDFK